MADYPAGWCGRPGTSLRSGQRFHLNPRHPTRAVAWSLALALVVASRAGASVRLSLSRVVLQQEAEVQFQSSSCEQLAAVPAAEVDRWQCSTGDSFRVCADLSRIRDISFRAFSYTLYAGRSGDGEWRDVTKWTFCALPIGSFIDQESDVSFEVGDDAGSEQGTIRLPLHSSSSDALLVHDLGRVPAPLWVGRPGMIKIGLRSLTDLHVVVTDDIFVSAGDQSLWQGEPRARLVKPVEGTMTIKPGEKSHELLSLELTPSRLKALRAALRPHKEDGGAETDDLLAGERLPEVRGVHEWITLYVSHRAETGSERDLEIRVPIRFRPSPLYLILAVLVGALVGRLIALLQRPTSAAVWARSLALAVLLSGVAWLAGLVLVEFDSSLRLLGMELDPYQIVPAALVGVVIGWAGLKGVKLVKELLTGG